MLTRVWHELEPFAEFALIVLGIRIVLWVIRLFDEDD